MFKQNGGERLDNLSVLVVDKSDFEITTIRRWLQQIGIIKIESTNSHSRAIKLIKKDRYDIILCEYDLTGNSGLELFKEVKLLKNYNPCFAMMTSSNDTQTMVELLESTPDDILVKPFSPDSFLKRSRRIMKSYKETKDIRSALNVGDYEKALSIASDSYYEELAKSSQSFGAWLEKTKIEIMVKQKRLKNVEQYTDLLLKNKKYDLEWVRTYNIKALLEQKSYDLVIERAQECLKRYPLSIKSYLYLGDAFYKKNQLKQSTKNYSRALELSKTSISAQRSISRVHHEIGDYEQALASYKRLMQLIDKSIEKRPEDFHQYANLKKESAEIILDENIDAALKESIAILKKGQESFPDDIVMDVLSDIMEAQDFLHKGKQKAALRKMEETMKEFEYVINRNGAALVNSVLTFQQLGKEPEVEKLKNQIKESKAIIDIPLTTLESRFNSFKNKDKESFDKITTVIKQAKEDLKEEKYTLAIGKLKSAVELAPNSLSIGFMLLDACISNLDSQKIIEQQFFTDAFSIYKSLKDKTTTQMEEKQILTAGKKLKVIQERKIVSDKERREKIKKEKERKEKERIEREKEKAEKQTIEKQKRERREKELRQKLIEEERNSELSREKALEKFDLSGSSEQLEEKQSEFLIKPVGLNMKEIEKVKITRENLTNDQIVLIKKLQNKKRYADLRKLTFQIKKSIYLRDVK